MDWTGQFDRLYIGGEWVRSSSPDRIAVISPFTEEVIAHVPSATSADIDAAVVAAREAFDHGVWRHTNLDDRLAVLRRLSTGLAAHEETFANVLTDEMGCPITQSVALQARVARLILDTYLETVENYSFSSLRRSESGNALVTREPVGVVGAIVPWNMPQNVLMHKLAPALLTGCAIVLKPAPETPLDSYLLAELIEAAGVPAGVVNVVPADREASESLVTNPGVDKIAFTGSTAAGSHIASLCGRDLRRVTLELGGKSAALILEDADLENAVAALRMGSFRNSGQVCTLKTRVLVPRSREAELLERLDALIASMPVGDPHDPKTQIGPMASARHRERVEGYIEVGKREGARAVIGGARPAGLDRGWFVGPTVFAGVEQNMRIAQEEIFGPVLSVIAYGDEKEGIEIANNSDFGLSGAVFTADEGHGFEIARRIRTGTVELNGNPAGWHAPFGGFKRSGIGREAGIEVFDSYTETQAVSLSPEMAARLAGEDA